MQAKGDSRLRLAREAGRQVSLDMHCIVALALARPRGGEGRSWLKLITNLEI